MGEGFNLPLRYLQVAKEEFLEMLLNVALTLDQKHFVLIHFFKGLAVLQEALYLLTRRILFQPYVQLVV